MGKVYLLSTNTAVSPFAVYPLGLAMIASAVSAKGHEVRQFDFLASGRKEELLRRDLQEFGPDYVGVSLRNIDSCDSLAPEGGWFLDIARRLVEVVREATDVPVILGGPAFSLLPKEILDYLGADYGIVGEGEKLMVRLLELLESGGTPPAIMEREEALMTGSEIGPPGLDGGLVGYYLERSGLINIQSKRGCPFACAYCTYPTLEGGKFRVRPPGAVVDEMERTSRDHGVETFFFTDSIFNDGGGAFRELAEELAGRELRLKWSAIFRPRDFDRDDLRLMKRAGLYAVEFGTDASSDETLGGLNKGFGFSQVLEANGLCQSEDIPCAHFIMFGGPGETDATTVKGLQNIERLGRSVVFGFSGIRILPGTALHERALREGRLGRSEALLRPRYYFSGNVDPEKLNSAVTRSFRGRRDRVFPPAEGELRMEVMRRFGFRGLLWDKLHREDTWRRTAGPEKKCQN